MLSLEAQGGLAYHTVCVLDLLFFQKTGVPLLLVPPTPGALTPSSGLSMCCTQCPQTDVIKNTLNITVVCLCVPSCATVCMWGSMDTSTSLTSDAGIAGVCHLAPNALKKYMEMILSPTMNEGAPCRSPALSTELIVTHLSSRVNLASETSSHHPPCAQEEAGFELQ